MGTADAVKNNVYALARSAVNFLHEVLMLVINGDTAQVGNGRRAVHHDGARLVVRVPEASRVLKVLVGWLKQRALDALAPRVADYAARLGRPEPRVAISSARTQWGVCGEDGIIRLSWRLVHIEPTLADYVVAHEVAHLAEMNHGPRFWRLVESLSPDTTAARAWLKRHRSRLLSYGS